MHDLRTINSIGRKLIRKKETIAVAESVTGGHLQAALSLAENARKFFQGGIVPYNIGQKVKLLDADPIHAESCNCVSATVAKQMAIGAARLFNSNYGVSVTGYAAPVPEYGIKKLFAFFAITRNGRLIKHGKIIAGGGEPIDVQLFYVKRILSLLSKVV